jgi:protein phosphatase
MLPISAHGTTFPGRREVNQDDILQFYPSSNSFFLAVADGMGGVAGGQVASEAVLEAARDYLNTRFQKQVSPSDLKDVLDQLYACCQDAINAVTKQRPSLKGMGTTLTCVLGYDDRFVVGNLGDSRAYYLHDGSLSQVTEDHSYLNELRRQSGSNDVDPGLAAKYGHIVSKTLDGSGDEPDFFPKNNDSYPLHREDGFLLCSDGMILEEELGDLEALFESYMLGTPNLQTAAESLVSLAYLSGSSDNISVVLAEVDSLNRGSREVRTYPFPPQTQEQV